MHFVLSHPGFVFMMVVEAAVVVALLELLLQQNDTEAEKGKEDQ